MLCLLMGLVCSVGWADTAPLAVSTSTDNPENQFHIRNGNNLYMGAYTSPTEANLGLFAFFAEDEANGKYKIYSIGQGKWVSYTQADSYSNGTNKAVLVDAQDDANVWNIATCTIKDGESGYEIRPYKSDGSIANIYMNWYGGTSSNPYDGTSTTVGFHGDAASGDKGSGWVLEVVDATLATEAQISEAKGIIKVAVGYPTTTSDAYIALQALTVGTATVTDVENAVNKYKTSSDILLPEDGKAYTIANYSLYNGGTTRYLSYVSGSALSVKEGNDNASVFVCRKLSEGVYAFITEDGKVLTWMGNADGFREEGSLLGYSSNYAMTYNDKSDWNDITVKKNGTATADFGLVRMVARRKSSQPSSFIIKGTTGAWDCAGDNYYYQNSSNYFSSAWIFTEVEHTNNTAETLALAKIDAKSNITTNAANLSESIGYYSYTADGTKLYTVEAVNAAIDAATTAEDVEAILNSYAVNLPEAGKMYRFGYDFGNGMLYIQSKNSSVRGLAMTSDVDGKSVFLVENIDGNLRLKSVWTGMYLNENGNTRGLNLTSGNVTFSAGAALGQIKIQAPSYCHANSSGENYFVDHCSSDGDHERHNFYAVEVTEEIVSPIPENGKTYYIYSDTYNNGSPVNRFLYANDSDLKMNTSLQVDPSYQWTCTVNDDGTMYFQNGDGKYLGYKTMSDEGYAFTVANTNVYNDDAVTLYANAASRYIVVVNDGSKFDQATATFNPQTTAYSTDFVFIEVNSVNVLTVDAPSVVEAEATWNGETKTLPATWAIYQGVTISEPTLSISYNAANYTFNGLTEGETSLGESVEIAALDANRTITAGFTPAFFSASTAAEDLVPVRVYNIRNNNYAIRLNTADDYTGHAVNSGTTAYGENEIWYLVGTAESFKMYSRTAGTDLALTLAGTTEASAATMTAEGTELCLTLTDNGYAISPKTNTAQSFNMYGGAGSDIKLYAVSDGGSVWGFQKVDVDKPLTLSVAVNGTQPYATNTRVGHLSFIVNGVESSTLIKNSVASQVCYLPVGATFSLGSDIVYRGYTFEGILDAEGNAATYEDAILPDGGINLTATYAVDADNKYQYLAYSPDETYGKPYRIPAIATASNGDVIAVYDYRPCGNDIGFGEVDIVFRRSTDNGATWTDEVCIADGQGGGENVFNAGFGDAALVADRESGDVLVMCVAGKQVFFNGTADSHNFMGRIRSSNNGQSWESPEDVTSIFLGSTGTPLFPNAYTMFFGSGRLLQSRVYKADGASHYRVYGALLVNHPDNADGYTGWHNYVVYSDDFGETWNILGGSVADGTCSNRGNEPKVEELPDGTIILSSRNAGGRIFNVFTYTDKATGAGTWGTDAASSCVVDGSAQGTNGEIMKVKAVRNEDDTVCDLMLQTVPKGPGRANVTVYYKEMEYNEDDTNKYAASDIAEGWAEGLCVSPTGSAYSTMTLQNDGNIGFFYEEEPSGYCMVYVPLSLSEMTNGEYSLYYESEDATALIDEAEAALAYTGVGYPTETAAARTALTEAVAAVKTGATYEGVATLQAALTAYTTSTDDIRMPQDGETYVIHNVLPGAVSNTAATNNVLRYDEATGVLTVAQKSATDDDAEKFVCRVIDAANNLYAFVNAKNGMFVLYYSPKSTEGTAPYAADNGVATGFSSSYNNVNDFYYENAKVNDLFIESQADTRFGTVSISCKANTIAYSGWITMVVDGGTIYMNNGRSDGNAQISYGEAVSALFAFEKVAYPNNPKLNTIDADDVCVHGLGEGKGIGTFSAPFATLLPEGVTAYYADSKTAGGVTLKELGTAAVPANQGVILVGDEGIASALMIPALTNGTEIAAGATIEGNQFSHTAGTTHVLELGDFVLGNRVNKGDGTYEEYGAAFYQGTVGTTLGKNKTYVVLGENTSAAKACHLNFGAETTGIESVNATGESTGAIYDLSGRRVTRLLKGGVYIRDGKKFIVK